MIDIDPVIFSAGGFAIRWYGLTFAAGIFAAIFLTTREARRRGLDSSKVTNVAIWGLLAGLAGARLFHVLDRYDYFAANPQEILMITRGGLAIWGGLAVGGMAALIVARREKLPVPALADAAVIGLLVGQVIGRIGCTINGDAYGGPTDLPWGLVYVNPGSMIPEELRGIATHPYPVYEMLWNLSLLGITLLLRSRRLPAGALFLIYAAGYALGRIGLTAVRQEEIVLLGLQQAQLVAIGILIFAVAGAGILIRRRRAGPAGQTLGAA